MRRFVAVLVPLVVLATTGAAPAAPDQGGSGPTALLPDIQTVVPQHLLMHNQQQRDTLRFSNGIANTGAGPWALRPEPSLEVAREQGLTRVAAVQELWDTTAFYRCGEQPKQVTECHNVVSERVAGEFEFHPEHNHWHIGDTAIFEVRQGSPTGPVVGGNSIKTTFCLIDAYKLVGNSRRATGSSGTATRATRGIAPGWVDQYHHATPGQQLDLTDVPNGDDYYLVSTSNFAGIFTESNPGNNTAWVKFRLYSDSKGNRKVEVTGNSPCVMGSGMCGENATNR